MISKAVSNAIISGVRSGTINLPGAMTLDESNVTTRAEVRTSNLRLSADVYATGTDLGAVVRNTPFGEARAVVVPNSDNDNVCLAVSTVRVLAKANQPVGGVNGYGEWVSREFSQDFSTLTDAEAATIRGSFRLGNSINPGAVEVAPGVWRNTNGYHVCDTRTGVVTETLQVTVPTKHTIYDDNGTTVVDDTLDVVVDIPAQTTRLFRNQTGNYGYLVKLTE